MAKYTPKIKQEKKEPRVPKILLILVWCLWGALILLDAYRAVFLSGIDTNDVFWDIALLAVAVYFTVRYCKPKA